MAVAPGAHPPAVFDLKSASLTLVTLVLRTGDLDELARELERRFGDAPNLFDRDPVVIDLAAVAQSDATIDFDALLALLKRYKLLPLAVRGGSERQTDAAISAGLADAPPEALVTSARPLAVPPDAPAEPETPTPAAVPAQRPLPMGTLIVDKPLRSGQQVYARGGDLVVLAVVSFGAEVIADGSIHVYAPLRGRAVAGTYRTTDTALPADVLGKPAQVRLDGEKLIVEALKL